MGIRDYLNRNPAVAAGLIAAVMLVAAYVFWTSSTDASSLRASKVYFTADGGATYFADDAEKIYPFDHNGRPAYRAYVFRCGSEAPFVSYYARYSEATKSKLLELQPRRSDPAVATEIAELISTGIEVQKVGTDKWVPSLSQEASEFTGAPPCKQAGVYAVGVVP
jgi:hypothetical protein